MVARRKITIEQVALEAGVSTQTVSRVINDRPDVSARTREMVQQVITRLGYQPSAIARSLASRHTRTLGLITADFSDYFFTQVIAGAEVEARRHGYFLMLGSIERNVQDEPEYLRLLTERQVEGILFARASTNEQDNRHLVDLLHEGVPIVTTAYHVAGESLRVVDVDNVDGARQATGCLLEHRHQRIAMLTGPQTWQSVQNRALGYSQALETAGIVVDQSLIAEGDWSYEGGYAAMQTLLSRDRSFTAVFSQNDQMAIGGIHALRDAGLRVPNDVSVVGYDDIPVAAHSDPPLTTIRQPMREVGAVATRLLIQAIEEPGTNTGEVLLKTELIRRRSCARR